MLSSIQLTNFQSHPDTKLDLDPGINAIIGSSDSGKTSILRALYWAVYNRPVGDHFVSYWARDKKGKQVKQCLVSIKKEKKGAIISRLRQKDFNGYCEDGLQLAEAIKTEVPEEVSNFFNLSEVNIQRQLDAPFLLSSTSGEVARFFNRIIKLDEIDKALFLIDKKKRDCNTDTKRLKQELEDQEKELATFNWIDRVEPIIEKAEKMEADISRITAQNEDLVQSIEKHGELLSTAKKAGSIAKLEGVLKQVEDIDEKLLKKRKLNLKIKGTIGEYGLLSDQLQATQSLLSIETSVDRTLKLSEKIKNKHIILEKLSHSIHNYEDLSEEISIISTRIKKMTAEMPEVCPLCNGTGRLK